MEFERALDLIRQIPDFPKPGILFLDITPILSDSSAFAAIVSKMSESLADVESIAGIEARGFILGSALANSAGKGFIPFRKKGKLPYQTFGAKYGLEYGDDEIEVHVDAFKNGERVLIVDDVLATGGTLLAAIELAERCGAIPARVLVLLEIADLNGRAKIQEKYPDIEILALKRT